VRRRTVRFPSLLQGRHCLARRRPRWCLPSRRRLSPLGAFQPRARHRPHFQAAVVRHWEVARLAGDVLGSLLVLVDPLAVARSRRLPPRKIGYNGPLSVSEQSTCPAARWTRAYSDKPVT
jgi:hypothetical protein